MRTIIGLAALLSAAGCARPLPPEMDAATARESITAALEAWKGDRQTETPIDFRDPAKDAGAKLLRYAIKSEERYGVSMRFSVELALRTKDGRERSRTTQYTVDAAKVVVIRPEM
jgi:hypothetical protein